LNDKGLRILVDLFGDMSDEEVDRIVELAKEERRAQTKRESIARLKELFSSQLDNLGKKLPKIAAAFNEEINRVAEEAFKWEYRSGILLPTMLPAMGPRHKKYPISGLLKLGGIIFPEGADIKRACGEPERGVLDEPYVILGLNALINENVSPGIIWHMMRAGRERLSAIDLDDAAAIFYNDIDLGKPPYSVLVLASLWNECPIVIKVDEEGRKTFTTVPWNEKIPGKVITPNSVGGMGLLCW